MKQEEFRGIMMKELREFDKWAWKDQMENPQDWKTEMFFYDWFEMFNNYIGDSRND